MTLFGQGDRKVEGQKIGREEKSGERRGRGDKRDFSFPSCCLIMDEKWGNRKLFYFVENKNKMTENLASKNLQLYSYQIKQKKQIIFLLKKYV